jgi:hypothetical protein
MNTKALTILTLILTVFMTVNVMAVQPFGANYTIVKPSERAPMDLAQNHSALAGNVTEINVFGYTITQTWQGYYGNVTGTIQLTDASDNVMYNWTLASPEGEIYATTDTSVSWASIACFDLTGNHSALETLFNIVSDDVDGINETFSESYVHDEFYTNNVQFVADDCPGTSIFDWDDDAMTDDNNFEEVLLTDSSSDTQVIFTAILDEEDVAGFDGATRYHDFQMLVLEDGHGTDTVTTQYYFYVELE